MATMPNNPFQIYQPLNNNGGMGMNFDINNNWSTGMNVMPAGYSGQVAGSQYYTPSPGLTRQLYQPFAMQNRTPYTGFGSDYVGQDKLFASGGDALRGVGSVLTGVGSLAQAWTAMKGLDLARESATNQQMQWNKNYDAQRTATNNAIADQNAWKVASGRSDLGSYVGDWSGAANLQPANRTA